jgi:aminocarboxymuconate-semialdehyde decarboxylase
MDQMGLRTPDEDYVALRKELGKRPLDYFKMFYADTSVNGSASAMRCGLDFFGADRVLFGTDCPFDPEGGPGFIRGTIKAIARLDLPDAVERKIYHENAFRMLQMNLALSPGGKPAAQPRKK